jgi:ubiquinone/menaquinone biosynthesis C-methylase UbiE
MNNKSTGERLEPGTYNETTIEHLHRYALVLDLIKNKIVLDIACGEGYGSNLMADVASSVTAIDNNSDAIGKANSKYRKKNVTFVEGNVEQIPLPASQFDIAISFETIEHVRDYSKMLSEIKRVLKPEGLLIISTPNKKTYSEESGRHNPHHVKEFYEKEFEGLLQGYFQNIEMWQQQTTLVSLISSTKQTELEIYEGDYDQLGKAENLIPHYFIALASDGRIPAVRTSIFNGQFVYNKILAEREAFVANSLTYRTGHFFLYPFKVIRNLFRRKH